MFIDELSDLKELITPTIHNAFVKGRDIKALASATTEYASLHRILSELEAYSYSLVSSLDGLDFGPRPTFTVSKELGMLGSLFPYAETLICVDAANVNITDCAQQVAKRLIANDFTASGIGFCQGKEFAPRITRCREGIIIDGFYENVPFASSVNALVISILVDGLEAIAMLDIKNKNLIITNQNTLGCDELFRVNFKNCTLLFEDFLIPPKQSHSATILHIKNLFKLRQAAKLLGMSIGMHKITSSRADNRTISGLKLIDFQSVSFQLAKLMIEIYACQLKLDENIKSSVAGHLTPFEVTEVLALTLDVAMRTARTCIQFHGSSGLLSNSQASVLYRASMLEALRYESLQEQWKRLGKFYLDTAQEIPVASLAG